MSPVGGSRGEHVGCHLRHSRNYEDCENVPALPLQSSTFGRSPLRDVGTTFTASQMGQSLLILSRSLASCCLLCVLQHQRQFFCFVPMLRTLTLVTLTPVYLPECISPKLGSIPKSIGRTLRARSRNTSCQWEQWDVSTSHQSR